LCFALEARKPFGIGRKQIRQHLDRDVALQPRILRAIHLSPFRRHAGWTGSHTGRGEEGDSFRADKPKLWSEGRFLPRPRQRSFDLHPDGERFALAAVPEAQSTARQDKVLFIFNFFDELRRLAPGK
jgi:hypothetical protein